MSIPGAIVARRAAGRCIGRSLSNRTVVGTGVLQQRRCLSNLTTTKIGPSTALGKAYLGRVSGWNTPWLQHSHMFPRARRRAFSVSASAAHGHLTPPPKGEEIRVTFIDKEGDSHTFEVAKGDNLLDIAQANDLEMEGACGGSCACSTCHVIVTDPEMYDKMPEPDDDENDMLDLAFGLTETSRLGCQVKMAPELDGLTVQLPSMTRNLQASDFQEKKRD